MLLLALVVYRYFKFLLDQIFIFALLLPLEILGLVKLFVFIIFQFVYKLLQIAYHLSWLCAMKYWLYNFYDVVCQFLDFYWHWFWYYYALKYSRCWKATSCWYAVLVYIWYFDIYFYLLKWALSVFNHLLFLQFDISL